jgi:heat shock protein HslJ
MIATLALVALLQAAYEGVWIVEVIDNIKVLPESRVTLKLEGGAATGMASLSGSASCNTFRGTLTLNIDGGVKVGQVIKTMKVCDAARMSEETDFFLLLNDVVDYEVRSDTLMLRTSEGKTITARRSTPTSVP